jgi:hypothetical protein
VRGPLPTRSQHPLALTMPALGLRRAVTQPAGEVGVAAELAYTSIFEQADRNGFDVLFDTEMLRGEVRLRAGLSERVDLETQIAASYATGGFLDSFISDYHDFFGFPNSGRESVENGASDAHVSVQNEEAYSLHTNEVGFHDLPLILAVALDGAESVWHNALRAVVELPTGSESHGFGNGGIDFGLGWCLERSSGRWSHFGAANWVHPSQPDGFDSAGIELDDQFELAYALECRWSEVSSLVVQLDGVSPLTRDVPYEELDAPMLDLGIGVWGDMANDSRCFLSFHDDLISASGPDFTVYVGWAWNW